MNSIMISGRLTNSPELRTTESGVPVSAFSVAVRRPGSPDKTDFFNAVAWRKDAEFLTRYFQKGSRIEISGVLCTRKYEDRVGKTRTAYEIKCERIDFGGNKSDKESVT